MKEPKRLTTCLLLASFAALIFFSRLHTYSEPLDRDIVVYSVAAHEVLKGRDLYSEIWDHKPPGVHFAYGLAEVVGGYGESGVFFLTLLTAYGTMLGCFALGRLIADSWAGVFSALSWAIVSGGLAMQANKPNTEVIMNLCLVLGLYCFLRAQAADKTRNRLLAAAGCWFAYATTVKQVTVVLPILLAALLLFEGFRSHRSLKPLAADLARLALPGILLWGAIVGYFAVRGRFDAFYECVIAYNRHYSGSVLRNIIDALTVRQAAFPHYMFPLIGVFLLALLGVVLTLKRDRIQGWTLLLWALSCFVMAALPGRWFPHYYQFWLPMISVASGLGIAALIARQVALIPPLLGALLALGAYAWFLRVEIPYYRLSPDEWCNLKDNDVFTRSRQAAFDLSSVVKPGERWWHWGSEPHLYFYSNTSPPIGFYYHYPLISGFKTDELSRRALAELEKNPPDLIISDNEALPPLLNQWVETNYFLERGRSFYGFSILRRRAAQGFVQGLTR